MGLYEKAKKLVQTSVLEGMYERKTTSEVIGKTLTLRDVEIISYIDKTLVGSDKKVEYTVWLCVDENSETFCYRGGSALNEIYYELFDPEKCKEWEENLTELRDIGLKVILTETTTRSNQPFVNVAVVE